MTDGKGIICMSLADMCRVLCLLDDLRGDVADAVSFRTPVCEPDAPSPPKLHARTINSITLKWNVCTELTTLMMTRMMVIILITVCWFNNSQRFTFGEPA